MRAKLAVIILSLCVTPSFGQTVSDIEMKYGKPIYAYSVSEHIWMTPEYSVDGQVCRMRLYPKRIAPETDYLSKQLYFEELKEVLNQLVPPRLRGAKKESFGLTGTGGGAAWTTYQYEKVTFVFTFSLRVDPRSWNELESHTFPLDEYLSRQPKKTPPSNDDFSASQGSKTEIVTVEWNDRRCAVN
jgi:hypothetical protein